MLPVAVRHRAREAREIAQRLVSRRRELGDCADVLMRELEVALRALREAAVREPPRSSNSARVPKRPANKREKHPRGAQPQLPSLPAATPSTPRVLPMELQVGDRLADETGE